MVDGLGVDRRVRIAEHRPHVARHDGQEVIGAGQSDPPGQRRRAGAGAIQPARVQRQHGRDITARTVASDEDARRIATIGADMALGPRDRHGGVAQEVRKAGLGIEPVVGDNGHHAASRQRVAHEPVIGPFAAAPTTAVEKNHHWRAGCVRWPVDVQTLTRQCAVGHAHRDAAGVVGHRAIEQRQRRTGGQQAQGQRGHGHDGQQPTRAGSDPGRHGALRNGTPLYTRPGLLWMQLRS
ncbi:hypothetical protein D3C72_1460040 [compost metagenome]